MTLAEPWNMLFPMPHGRDWEAYHDRGVDFRMPFLHAHSSYEFYFFIQGNVTIYLEDAQYNIEPFDVLIYPPGLLHRSGSNDSKTLYERFYFYASPDFIRAASGQGYDMDAVLSALTREKRLHFHFPQDVFLQFQHTVDEVAASGESLLPADQFINRCRIHLMLATICKLVTGDGYLASRGTSTRINDLIRHLNKHINESVSLDALAERYHVSKYLLAHEFKAYTNTSIHQYIIAKRLLNAQLLMRQGVSPGEAARQCGYNDYAGFYRAFLSKVHISPQEFYAAAGNQLSGKPIDTTETGG